MPQSNLNTQRETILHYWNLNVRSAKKIRLATDIPMRTIYNNLKKIEQSNGRPNRKKWSGRPKKTSPIIAKQSIRRNSSISLRTLETKLLNKGYHVSRTAISRHLSHLGYNKNYQKLHRGAKTKTSRMGTNSSE